MIIRNSKSRKVNAYSIPTVIFRDIFTAVSVETGLSVLESRRLCENILNLISELLISGRSVRIKDVGTLALSKRNPRSARDISRNREILLPEKYSVTLVKHSSGRDVVFMMDFIDMCIDHYAHFSDKMYSSAYRTICKKAGDVVKGNTRIEIRGFGSFYPSFIEEKSKHPGLTGEKDFIIPAHYLIRFKPAKVLLNKINENLLP